MNRTPSAPRKTSPSWLALLAVTSLGVESADTLHTLVRSEEPLPASRTYRLVVQSYDAAEGELPADTARPVASVQRVVTGAELRAGIQVPLVELRDEAPRSVRGGARPVVIAWVIEGASELEFDGRRARPLPGSVYGVTPRTSGSVEIALSRHRLSHAA